MASAELPPRKEVLKLAARVADWQLARLDAAHITHFKEETRSPLSWEQGAFWVGMTRLADASGEKRFREAILAQGRANQWKPGPRLYHADDHVIAQSYLWAARNGAGAEAIAPLRATFDAILAKPAVTHLSFYIPKNYEDTACLRRWCWCDALFMSPPAWAELDPADRRCALPGLRARRVLGHHRLSLRSGREALFPRQPLLRTPRRTRAASSSGAAAMAGCSPGWPTCSTRCRRIIRNARGSRHCFARWQAKLKAIQKPDGYWAPSLLGPENSPPETSGTGFYTYGLAWGVKNGLLDAQEYGPSIERGWAALARAVAKDGRLGWVQQVSDRPENVAETDTQFYGVGAFLLAASAVASLAEK